MPVSEDYYAFINDQLDGIEGIYSKKMFGGVGYFKDDLMFGGIMEGVFRLKADSETIPNFEKYDCSPWQIPGKPIKMPYYEVPQTILEDRSELKKWVQDAYLVAKRTKKPKKKKKSS
ncbi:MAG: TfoX/Sxy family protein [Crocinitomicaceae bacterium]|nr:TfoX/Sxy family protein [Crocinitomicaceae bacterium]